MSTRIAIVVLMLAAGPSSAQGEAPQPGPVQPGAGAYAGLTLEEALLALADQGLELVFSERVVRPEMRVEAEPTAGEARDVLRQLLRPHGLTVREGAGGVLVVVSAELEVGDLRGSVREWRSGRPMPGVEIRVTGSDHSAVTAAGGAFSIDGVAAGSHFLQASRAGFMVLQTEIEVRAGGATELVLELRPTPLEVEEIDVHARRQGLLGEAISTLRLERQELLALPRLGEDVLRPVTLLPGTAGNDVSARFHVRGGRSDEVMIRLDGFEILEPYHLQDFGSALGIVSPDVVADTELLTGAFPVRYGDRMGGVLDLSSREPSWRRRTELGLSVLFAEASGSGTLSNGRGHWLAALRAGSLEPVASLANEEENPRFSDAFGKLGRTLGPGRSLRVNLLLSADALDFIELLEPGEESDDDEPPDQVRFRTAYDNIYAWLGHQAVFAEHLHLESRASISRVDRDRRGTELYEDDSFVLDDQRRLLAAAVAQDFSARLGRRHELEWGFEVRFLDADFDYLSERDLADPLALIGPRPPEDEIDFDRRFRGEQYAVYLGDRFTPTPRATVDLGLRYDKNTVLDDSNTSPRLSFAYQLRPRNRLKLAWGLFHQSQRLYELQLEDGVTRFFPSERSEHRVVGFEHDFGDPDSPGRRPPALRVELYEHRISDPRPRFENLYDPITKAPEVEADRFEVAPESSRARGLEILLTGGGRRYDWFASYARSRIEDRIAGAEPADVPRSIDQPDAFKLGFTWRAPRRWLLHFALEARTGWPTTPIGARVAPGHPEGGQTEQGDDEPEAVPVLGPLYGERLPTYRRLDLRASRRFDLRRGELELIFDVQNLTDAENRRGFEVEIEAEDDGEVEVEMDPKLWAGFIPSIGLRWAF